MRLSWHPRGPVSGIIHILDFLYNPIKLFSVVQGYFVYIQVDSYVLNIVTSLYIGYDNWWVIVGGFPAHACHQICNKAPACKWLFSK